MIIYGIKLDIEGKCGITEFSITFDLINFEYAVMALIT